MKDCGRHEVRAPEEMTQRTLPAANTRMDFHRHIIGSLESGFVPVGTENEPPSTFSETRHMPSCIEYAPSSLILVSTKTHEEEWCATYPDWCKQSTRG